jgi:hypothetical protein
MLAALVLALALALAASPSAFARVFTGQARLVVRNSSREVGFRAFVATSEPATSSSPSQATFQACDGAPDSAGCISSALSDIDAARAAEGVRPMQLPGDFASMNVPQQLLVVTNLERVDRGLAPVAGLAADLDSAAASAAAADQDPMLNHFNGTELASNWAGGISSTLLADFVWMYDDGPGSGNLDCHRAGARGCWGHRHNILYQYDNPVAMGVGYAANTSYGPSITELFIGGDTATGPGQADALLAPTWRQLSDPSGATTPSTPNATPAAVRHAGQAGRARTSVQIRVRKRSVRRGQKVTLTGRLHATGHALGGELVTLYRHAPASSKMTIVRRKRTGAGGYVRFHLAPRKNTVYFVTFSGSRRLAGSSSGSVEVRVRRHRSR